MRNQNTYGGPTARLFCAALFSSTLAASPALADEAIREVEASPAPASEVPEWRLDFILPTVGIGFFAAPAVRYEMGIVTLGGEVRFAHRSGNGLMLRGAHGTNVWGGGTAVDLAYLYRLDFVGATTARGASVDFALGPTLLWLSHNQGDVPVGAAVGGQAGLAFQGRYDNFTGSFGAQFHGFAPLEGAPNGDATGFEMAITIMGGLGFGFWG